MLHAVNVVLRAYNRILIIANGTYIIVLGTSFFNDTGADKLWVSFGIGNKCLSHLVFHAVTGCDTASSFA